MPADIGRLVSAADPTVSPDGRLIAFVVARVDLDANRYRSSVWLAAADGTSRRTSSRAASSTTGRRSGRRTGAARVRGGARRDRRSRRALHAARPSASRARRSRSANARRTSRSRSGRRTARASRSCRGSGRTATPTADERAREPRRIDRLFSRMDGAGWIVDRPASVFVVPVDGSAPPRAGGGRPVRAREPAWSPDGTRLAVARPGGQGLGPRTRRASTWSTSDGRRPDSEPAADRLRPSHTAARRAPDGARIVTLASDNRIVPSRGRSHGRRRARPEPRRRCCATHRTAPCAPYRGTRAPIWDDGHLCSRSRTAATCTCTASATARAAECWSAAPGS